MRGDLTAARASTGAGTTSVGFALLAAGAVDAFVSTGLGIDLGIIGAVVAWVALAGFPLVLLGRRRRGADPPPHPPALAEEPAPEPSVSPSRSASPSEGSQRTRRVQAVVNAGDGMVMVFQPIVDLRDGTPVGHEALARFPDGRPANEWFDEAHALGVGIELEMTAIMRAVDEFNDSAGYLSINLSPPTLTSREFVEFIAERTDVSKLVIELTEHAVVEDYAAIRSAIEAVRDLGARIAVDDAGSGISSMRHILTLSPDIIKLDRSLIATIDSDPARRALALSLAKFATDIGADLVAEGVERAAEMTACYESGVRYAQGYLLGRPGPLQHAPGQQSSAS